ncbi:hypothetical protein A3A49_01695 [Candidatus Curtissbacteria bacterium RIFCSPLOWO2_01_FULL_38_11b]|uniref:Apea-like HEPN domain-containing protein n=1 Tax=Candidatus Curtissbacteria bacterium RIFCSPLOWO2_01_FULL_38_11b TaxID=1797725 RepID=A0A1F5H0D2_9BACT|nr:MAG: hypothetical protein A3A49_01695 [Candidatus Curtissbacteria bacterium RIFCSPLOWO2_01_FULL_38_11b]
MKQRFLTNFSPKQTQKLGDLIIKADKRVSIKSKGNRMWHDSLIVTSKFEDRKLLNNWVIFHTFTLASGYTLSWYEEEDYSPSELIVEDANDNYLEDYGDIARLMYFPSNEKYKKLDYSKLYSQFLLLDRNTLDIVKNSLNSFTGGTFNPEKKITDATYWQIMVSFSVIEAVIGRQPYCSNNLNCEVCNRTGLPHSPQSSYDWIAARINELVSNVKVATDYTSVIVSVWKHIRNDTVHNSAFPSAVFEFPQKADKIVYDVKRSIGDYDKDATALMSLNHLTHDVARYLLLDKVFHTEIFPSLRPLISQTVALGKKSTRTKKAGV